MSGSDALTTGEGPEVGEFAPIFLYDDLKFDSFCVAEPNSNRPAHFARLLKILMRKGRSREDAEDLIQEAMLKLHLYAMRNVVVNEEAFLIHAVRNLAIDHYRRDRSMEGRVISIDDLDRNHPLIAEEPTPDEILDSQQRLDQLKAILDSASRRTREVYLAHRSGYTGAEIANNMGIAEITAQRHITRGNLIVLNLIEK